MTKKERGHVPSWTAVTLLLCGGAQNYLEEMAAMLLQAHGDGSSAAGTRLQRLSTELVPPRPWLPPPPSFLFASS